MGSGRFTGMVGRKREAGRVMFELTLPRREQLPQEALRPAPHTSCQ